MKKIILLSLVSFFTVSMQAQSLGDLLNQANTILNNGNNNNGNNNNGNNNNNNNRIVQ